MGSKRSNLKFKRMFCHVLLHRLASLLARCPLSLSIEGSWGESAGHVARAHRTTLRREFANMYLIWFVTHLLFFVVVGVCFARRNKYDMTKQVYFVGVSTQIDCMLTITVSAGPAVLQCWLFGLLRSRTSPCSPARVHAATSRGGDISRIPRYGGVQEPDVAGNQDHSEALELVPAVCVCARIEPPTWTRGRTGGMYTPHVVNQAPSAQKATPHGQRKQSNMEV